MHSGNAYLVHTGVLYPYYDCPRYPYCECPSYPFYACANNTPPDKLLDFKPTWELDFEREFASLLDRDKKEQTKNYSEFINACVRVQTQLRGRNAKAHTAFAFKNVMDTYFKAKFPCPRAEAAKDEDLWKLAKAAVTLYKHCLSVR